MTPLWNNFLTTIDAQAEGGYFTDMSKEASMILSQDVIAPLAEDGLISVEGEDAGSFLHNLLTNDISGLPVGHWCRAGLCTPKGRMLADFLVWKEGDVYYLRTAADIALSIHKKLSMYVLRSKVKLTDAANRRIGIGFSGPDLQKRLSALNIPLPQPGQVAVFDGGVALGITSTRVECWLTPELATQHWSHAKTKAEPVGAIAWRLLDITACFPKIVKETQELFVPQMVNFELIGGIGFKKGCYPGQEIVARTQYLGKIKRRMYRATLSEGSAEAGQPVFSDATGEQACGDVAVAGPPSQSGQQLLIVVPASHASDGQFHLASLSGPTISVHPSVYPVE